MIPVSSFYSRVLPHVVGCPDPVMAQAVVDASILFCDDSMALRDILDPITTVAGQVEYDLDRPDADHSISRIANVWFDGALLTPVARAVSHVAEFPVGTPTHYVTRAYAGAFQLRLYPAPDTIKTVVVEVATRPSRTANQLDDDLLDQWADTIIHGAVARICTIAGQPYSDPVKASQSGAAFMYGCRKARIEGNVGRVTTAMSVSPRAFA